MQRKLLEGVVRSWGRMCTEAERRHCMEERPPKRLPGPGAAASKTAHSQSCTRSIPRILTSSSLAMVQHSVELTEVTGSLTPFLTPIWRLQRDQV